MWLIVIILQTKMTSNIRLVKRNHSFLTILSSISWVIFSLNFVALRMMFANILLQYAKMEAKTQFNKNEGKGERLICSQLRSKNDRKNSRIRGDNLSDHQQSKLSPWFDLTTGNFQSNESKKCSSPS
jgi:hypothetical protein